MRVPALRAQARAALGSAVIQDLATTACRHSSAETMRTLALQFAGLKCSFHDVSPASSKTYKENNVLERARRARDFTPADTCSQHRPSNETAVDKPGHSVL